MDDQEKSIFSYLEIALRRKWWIIIPFLASFLVSFAAYKYLPKVYKSTTLILVQPQKVPESYIRSTITSSVADQLNTISQEILSRTRLEKIIQVLNPYPDLMDKLPMEEIVEKMRKSIEINLQGRQNAFSVAFQGEDPKMVMQVTNQLASLFIEEHLKIREIQAENTSQFLGKELAGVTRELMKKEQDLKLFRERNMGKLPQQLDANLRILERLQQQLQNTNLAVKTTEDRILILQGQMEQLKKSISPPSPRVGARGEPPPIEREGITERGQEAPVITQWRQLTRELKNALSKYTENHPDIMDLKRKIARLEPEAKAILQEQEDERQARLKQSRAPGGMSKPERAPASGTESFLERLLAQYHEQYTGALLEAERMRTEEKKLKQEIVLYRKRIEETPKLEQELILLNRDYDLLRSTYQSLMDKKVQSQMSENLERKQQGEQFKVLDPARYPEKPIRPELKKIFLMGAGIGLLAGLGLAWFRESMDQSFHSEEEVEADLGLPILATIPNLKEERSLVTRR